MRRRDFIKGVVGAATTWPLAGRAQQLAKVHRIAVVHPYRPAGRGYDAFLEKLSQLGYIEGSNLHVERCSGEGKGNAELVRNVVHANPDVIFAASIPLLREFAASTTTIPIVALVGDPVAYGLVPNLARPAGNITGVSIDAGIDIWSKRLELLMEAVPGISKVGFLTSTIGWEDPHGMGVAMREAARRKGVGLIVPSTSGEQIPELEYQRVLTAIAREHPHALVVGDSPENIFYRKLLAEVMRKDRIPAIYPWRESTEAGGLMAYSYSTLEIFHHAAGQVDEILKGVKPGDIPFYQPTKFDFVINLQTAKILGIALPLTLLARADEVIE
jgi:putative ABC transport system substrate-binding protein